MHRGSIGYFISAHGYGHAARATAVMMALQTIEPGIRFEIFTTVPRVFFEDSIAGPIGYHPVLTDIGLVQKNSLVEDIPETVRRLNDFLPFDPVKIQDLARLVRQLRCRLILCDIAPLGLAVAKAADLPSVLIENFTWDWIYQGYLQYDDGFGEHIPYLRKLFTAADFHIQTEPVCEPQNVDLVTNPVSRPSRTPVAEVRRQLPIPTQAGLVMVTMGGGTWPYNSWVEQLKRQQNIYFIIAGKLDKFEQYQNLIMLPRHSKFFHPDLVNAADAAIGKVGYSTLAEVYQAGIPFGYLARPRFRESLPLTTYLNTHMHGLPLTEAQLGNGEWLSLLPDLLALPHLERRGPNGAEQIAEFINRLLDSPRI